MTGKELIDKYDQGVRDFRSANLQYANLQGFTACGRIVDIARVLVEIEDFLMPQCELDPIERVLYYHLFRHTRLIGKETSLFALLPLAQATGLSETSVREHVRSLHEKKCIEIIERSKNGHMVKVLLPEEMPGLDIAKEEPPPSDISLIDFYTGRKYLAALLKRECGRCFYCLAVTTAERCVLDHVIPQVQRNDNSYRNIVVACHSCNSEKQEQDADGFLRSRYRQGLLSQAELQERLAILEKLRNGDSFPNFERPLPKFVRPQHNVWAPRQRNKMTSRFTPAEISEIKQLSIDELAEIYDDAADLVQQIRTPPRWV